MMQWTIARNTISQINLNGNDLILPWGIETADSSAFFSMEDGCGYRYKVLSQSTKYDENSYCAKREIQMKEGRWELSLKDQKKSNNTICRSAELYCLEDSYFMDFVMRFRFRNTFFSTAKISDKIFSHVNSNIYHQFPVTQASVEGSQYKATVTATHIQCPDSMKPHMYVRDAENEWVVHARMLPVEWEKEVIKLCNEWAQTRPLPQSISSCLLFLPKVKESLWYRMERAPFTDPIFKRIRPQAQPIVRIPKGEILRWEVEVVIDEQ